MKGKPIYKEWWFWTIIVLSIMILYCIIEIINILIIPTNTKISINELENNRNNDIVQESTLERKIKDILKNKQDINIVQEDKNMTVTYKTDTPFTYNSLLNEVLSFYVKIGKEIYTQSETESFNFIVNGTVTDQYGTESIDKLIEISMPKENFQKYNWENLEYKPIYNSFIKDTEIFYILFSIRKELDLDKIFITL